MSNISTMHNISGKISQTEKGAPNGVPVLDESGDVPVTQLNLTKSDVGLANVDNTSDTDKPISSATQTALNAKANSADAVSTNTANKIVLRDGSGNFSAGTITAGLSGNASTASTLATARTLTIGSTGKSFNGSANVAWSLSEIGAWGASNDGTGSGLDADMLDGLHASSFTRKIAEINVSTVTSAVQFTGLNIQPGSRLLLRTYVIAPTASHVVMLQVNGENSNSDWKGRFMDVYTADVQFRYQDSNIYGTSIAEGYISGYSWGDTEIYITNTGDVMQKTQPYFRGTVVNPIISGRYTLAVKQTAVSSVTSIDLVAFNSTLTIGPGSKFILYSVPL